MSDSAKKIIIIGAGGFAREVYGYLEDLRKAGARLEITGFLDDNPHALNGFAHIRLPILHDTSLVEISLHHEYICAIGDVLVRERFFQTVTQSGGRFFTLIHPSALVFPSCRIGEGSIVCPGVILTDSVVIGQNTVLNLNVLCGHDVSVADHSVLSPQVNVTGKVSIGKKVFIGSSAVVTPGARIGDRCRVSAGSVVYKRWGGGLLLHGNPAKAVKQGLGGSHEAV